MVVVVELPPDAEEVLLEVPSELVLLTADDTASTAAAS